MALVALVGSDDALLEGLSQTLAAAGHRTVLGRSLGEMREGLGAETPLVMVLARDLARSAATMRLPMARGGALVLYRTASAAESLTLPLGVQRLVLADLVLPLERARLIRLIESLAAREYTGGEATPSPTPRF